MTTVAVSSLPQGTSVTLRNVTKSFGTTKVLNGLDQEYVVAHNRWF